ncbi:thioredoxin [Hydrogenophaga sp. OTU3427]|uniref:thioredoxin n=1 Tax=Hydrogenophaga sp. OTU3427 TaxID=3043856 RepID=UPI00313E4297
MIDVTIANFETEVIEASMTTPVLVDFWAPWCGPCKSLGPVLEKVEEAYAGRFKLVKINSDDEQQLAGAFGIRSIPTCVLLMNGQPVDGFMGALPEGQVKAFLDKHLPPADELPPEVLEEAPVPEPVAEPGSADALAALAQAVADKPDDDNVRFDFIKALLLAGRTDDAKVAFAPVIAKAAAVRKLEALQHWMNALDVADNAYEPADAALAARIATNKRDFDARYELAQHHMAAQRWTAAMDELLEILMRDKAWNSDLARKTYVAILEIIDVPKPKVAEGQIPPEDPTVATYRRRLSSVVLS